MSNLFRWGILPAFLMTFSGMSQDIAAPSMANVDLEMEDEKKIAAYREAAGKQKQKIFKLLKDEARQKSTRYTGE